MKKIKILITGGSGFVGKYLISALEAKGTYEIRFLQSDIRDQKQVLDQIQKDSPDFVIHLAAQAFVPRAIEDPWETENINVMGTLNLLEGLHRLKKPVRMLYVSSSDVYGRQRLEDLPYNEALSPNPLNPYSGSKLAAETYCKQYALYNQDLQVIIARPFNHIGVGQRKEFVIPNFCHQVVNAKKRNETFISVGDLSPTRDFLNVKDIVDAYITLIETGSSGEVYNICSGKEISIQWMAESILKISGYTLEFRIDQSRIRSAETNRVFGDNTKIKNLGWSQKYEILDALTEIYRFIEAET
ncbi:nucleoside-diphosphate sugar epimerase [Leptospira ryugenii]|uniref:Nucleoside-diphosphate sugar epimerase n=1 Tax=Leptospira ryugenii TaxID=1917863 RepID=A0A2P2E3T2_9LEPT|nr:nucleoside-diphosphate sugar epimerase [Leptospira ryugenii]